MDNLDPNIADRPKALTVLRAASYRRMPWKNGGGETSEIALFPPGATLDTMNWRISMAVVAQDGPFSIFPGIDRTLGILEGRGMELDFGEHGGKRTVTRDTAPYHFPADLSVHARLLDGAITDLNVMSRRDHYRHSVERLVIDGHLTLDITAHHSLLFCELGTVSCAIGGEAPVELGSRDSALMLTPPGIVELSTPSSTAVYLIQLHPAARSA